MADSKVTGVTSTMLCTKLESLKIELSLPDARYQKNKKKIKISVDDKVEWSYKWTKAFAPPLGQDLIIPISSTVKIVLIGKRRIRDHLLGSYSGRIIDFLDKDKPFTLENDQHGACATITMGLSSAADYQQALIASVDASLARLDNSPRLEEGLDMVDQANSSMQVAYSAVETYGQYIAPLGQALRLMIKLIDNVADAHPLLKVGWTLLSSAVQEQRLNDDNVRGLAESLRELVGVASDCPVTEIKGTPGVIESIERLALEVASLIDEYTKSSFAVRVGRAQITDVTARITKCQAELNGLYEKLRTRIMAYTANRVKEMQECVEKMQERAKETQEDAKRKDAQKHSNKMRKWLNPHNSSVNHKLARDTRVEGTGSWLAKDERFRRWLDEPGTELWIAGAPGFGKTVLFSTSVEVVRTHASARGARCCCAYSYFDARESGGASRKFETLLRSILGQLCFNRADVPDAMKRLYGVDSDEHPEPTLAQLSTTLGEVVKGFDDVYILIDALDECESQGKLLDWMTSLQSTTPGLHLLATSRPERIIEERMSKSSHICISLNSELLDDDIKTYVDERVEASDDLKLLMTEEMKKRLRVRGDGMFRLVAFWIDELKDCRSLKTVRDKLEHLPTSLNDMYTSMVLKIKADDLEYAKAIMPWLLFSAERLKLEEIAAAAWFGYSDGRPAFDKDRGFAHPKAVLDVFGGLVVMSDDGVTLAHLTVKEFLLEPKSPLHVNEPDAHSFIARCCLTYLLDQFPPRVAAGVQGFPLHKYAVQNWMHHASSTRDIEDTQSVIYELALQVLHPEHETFRVWSRVWNALASNRDRDTYLRPLFVSARWGLQNLTARLLVLGVGMTRSRSGRTALHLASEYGHLEVVKILLDGPISR
ncbi:hypothetical protein PAXINDRAFT_100315 [Paxillus involutus ATCC 200175]|uniref:Nephrocystin 3-like N-terminal domain-containing protein n=1 Tax=Paxillus involutus ATCC 200175 TaxID=664439 RepID=A0A0C9U4E0_PAXIN|nr:hypothetical protein PAXINDRAFT_100315 [Paxillus involutus ATCC 200175]